MNTEILNKPVHCEVREYNLKILQRNITAQDLIKIEVLIKLRCDEAKVLEHLYNDLCIELSQNRKILDDPTTQE